MLTDNSFMLQDVSSSAEVPNAGEVQQTKASRLSGTCSICFERPIGIANQARRLSPARPKPKSA